VFKVRVLRKRDENRSLAPPSCKVFLSVLGLIVPTEPRVPIYCWTWFKPVGLLKSNVVQPKMLCARRASVLMSFRITLMKHMSQKRTQTIRLDHSYYLTAVITAQVAQVQTLPRFKNGCALQVARSKHTSMSTIESSHYLAYREWQPRCFTMLPT
jgi:hypothetical protein